MLSTVFPEFPWDITKFTKVPKDTWNSSENYRKFLDSMSEDLKLQSLDDWYNVSYQVKKFPRIFFIIFIF